VREDTGIDVALLEQPTAIAEPRRSRRPMALRKITLSSPAASKSRIFASSSYPHRR